MGISDVIASFIQSALDETDGVLELQRSDLAQRFGSMSVLCGRYHRWTCVCVHGRSRL